MASKWVYFPPGEDSPFPYRKAHIQEQDLEFFLDLGASEDQLAYSSKAVAKDEDGGEEEPYIPEHAGDPDKGFGEPGSVQFHENTIMDFLDKQEIVDYTHKVTGRKIVKRGGLADVQRNAMKRIKEFLDND